MIEFRKASLKDKPRVDSIVFAENSPSADFNFGNIYIWDKRYCQLIAFDGDRMLTKVRYDGQRAFAFPIGTGDLKSTVDALREYAARKNYEFMLRGVTDTHIEQLEACYPGLFSYREDRANADYIYLAEKLATYSGKALHGKKNHCNRFEAEHSWEFVPLTRELIPLCLDMLDVWSEDNSGRLESSISYEHDAIVRAFAAYEELGLEGGVLFADGRTAGFTVGEFTSCDTFDVHFEKAVISMNGAYPMVCRELVRMLLVSHPGLVYINREDDMGLEALRKSKESYKPEYLLRKYTAFIPA